MRKNPNETIHDNHQELSTQRKKIDKKHFKAGKTKDKKMITITHGGKTSYIFIDKDKDEDHVREFYEACMKNPNHTLARKGGQGGKTSKTRPDFPGDPEYNEPPKVDESPI